MNRFWQLFPAGLLVVAFWCLADLVYVKIGQPQTGVAPLVWFLLYAVLPVAFYLRLRSLAPGERPGPQVGVALLTALIWFLPACLALKYFHIAIGGGL